MIKHKVVFIAGLIFLVMSAGLLLYPVAAPKIYQIEANQVIREFDDRLQEKRAEEALKDRSEKKESGYFNELYKKMKAYNRNLYKSNQENLVDAFAYEQTSFDLTQFGFDENMIGYIEIPRMRIRLPIYLGANEPNMRLGAVHLTETSLPIGGKNTNSVIAGHRGLSGAAMFRDIESLQIGDPVTITNFREKLAYRVVEIAVILPTETDKILIQPNRDLVTLITCHPYRHNDQRYVVYCERSME